VAAYSLRGGRVPTASTPVSWAEVEAVASHELPGLAFGPADVLERVRSVGDLFAPVLTLRQALPAG
jgi:bifunctional non-homologous end joining protein LigD